jgi:hypothetical protein
VGNRAGSRQTATHASNYGLHVRQLIADILYHDGLDGKLTISIEVIRGLTDLPVVVLESYQRHPYDKFRLLQIRIRAY